MKFGPTSVAIGAGVILAASLPGAAQAADAYPPGVQPVSCLAYTNGAQSKLTVNMGPNQPGSRYYTFRLERQRKGKWVRYRSTYRTKGLDEHRTLNLPKGTYRAKCNGKYGFTDAISNSVTLRK